LIIKVIDLSYQHPLRELEMLSPWFDASSLGPSDQASKGRPPVGPAFFVVVLAPPRVGSFHLCRLLWGLGYGQPTEYFNPHPIYRSALGRWGRWGRDPWLQTLARERSATSLFSGRPFFATKLQPFQRPGSYLKILERLQRPLLRAGLITPDPPFVVRLQRRNWQAATASLHFSRCTGSYDLGLETTHQGLAFDQLLDPEALTQTCAEMDRHRAWLEQACQALPPQLELSYEQLISDQSGQLGRLVAALEPDIDLASPDVQAALRRPIRREHPPWSEERRLWLQRLEATIRAGQHSSEPAGDRDPSQPGGAPTAARSRDRGHGRRPS